MEPAHEACLLAAVRRALRPPYWLDLGWDSAMTGHKWTADRHLFHDAIVVFGPHGGAMANVRGSLCVCVHGPVWVVLLTHNPLPGGARVHRFSLPRPEPIVSSFCPWRNFDDMVGRRGRFSIFSRTA